MFTFILQVSVGDEEKGSGSGGVAQCFHYVSRVPRDSLFSISKHQPLPPTDSHSRIGWFLDTYHL